MEVTIEEITVDPQIVGRVNGLDFVTVQAYADDMEAGAVFPPVEVVSNGDMVWLVDGQHRVEAAKKVNLEKIEANVMHGDYRDALLVSCGTNAEHGKRRTNEDKRRKVMMLLEDEEWQGWSSRKIAEKCKVGHKFVDKLRNHTGAGASMEAERTFIHHKTGQPTTMSITNIRGDNKEQKPKQIQIQSIKPSVKQLWWQYHNALLQANIISKTIAVNYDEYKIRAEIESDSFLRDGISKAIAVNNDFVLGVRDGFKSTND